MSWAWPKLCIEVKKGKTWKNTFKLGPFSKSTDPDYLCITALDENKQAIKVTEFAALVKLSDKQPIEGLPCPLRLNGRAGAEKQNSDSEDNVEPQKHLTWHPPKDRSTIDQFINVNLKYTHFHSRAEKTNIKHARLINFQGLFAIYFNTTRSDNLIKEGQWKANNARFIHCLGNAFFSKLSDTIYSKRKGGN